MRVKLLAQGNNILLLPDISKEVYDIEPEVLCKFRLPCQNEAPQVASVTLQELVDGVLWQGSSWTDVYGTKLLELSTSYHATKYLK